MKTLIILLFALLISHPDFAQYGRHGNRHARHHRVKVIRTPHRTVVVKRFYRPRLVVIRPRVIRPVVTAPVGIMAIRTTGFFFSQGWYYNGNPGQYVRVCAPRGLRIKVLPVGYHRIVYASYPVYYAQGTFYKDSEGEFETIPPVIGTVVPDLPEDDAELVNYEGTEMIEYNEYLFQKTDNGYQVMGPVEA